MHCSGGGAGAPVKQLTVYHRSIEGIVRNLVGHPQLLGLEGAQRFENGERVYSHPMNCDDFLEAQGAPLAARSPRARARRAARRTRSDC